MINVKNIHKKLTKRKNVKNLKNKLDNLGWWCRELESIGSKKTPVF